MTFLKSPLSKKRKTRSTLSCLGALYSTPSVKHLKISSTDASVGRFYAIHITNKYSKKMKNLLISLCLLMFTSVNTFLSAQFNKVKKKLCLEINITLILKFMSANHL